MKIKDVVVEGFVDNAKINNVARTAYDNFVKILGANNMNIGTPEQRANPEKYIPYAQGYALQFMASQETDPALKDALTKAINAVPAPTTFDKTSLQQYFKTAAQMRAAVKTKVAQSLPKTPEELRKAELKKRMDQARKEAEAEKLKKTFAQGFTAFDAKTAQAVARAAKSGDLSAALIKPQASPTAQAAPTADTSTTKERDPNATPLYTVVAPGGVKVTKYSDGLWIDDNDQYIGNPNDIKQLERLATAQKYSKGASIPKSKMPPEIAVPSKKGKRR